MRLFLFRALLMSSLLATPLWAGELETYQQGQALLDDYQGQRRRIKEARALFLQLEREHPDSALAQVGLLRTTLKDTYLGQDRFASEGLEQARRHLDKALARNPELTDGWYHGGWLHLARKDLEEAGRHAATLERLEPGGPRPALLRGEIALRRQDPATALKEVESIPAGSGKVWLDALRLKTRALRMQKKFEQAEAVFRELLSASPKGPWDQVNFAELLTFLGKNEEAIALAEAALAEIDFGPGHATLATASFRHGYDLLQKRHLPRQAIPFLEKAVLHNPTLAEGWLKLGLARREAAMLERNTEGLKLAREAYGMAMKLEPASQPAREGAATLNRLLQPELTAPAPNWNPPPGH